MPHISSSRQPQIREHLKLIKEELVQFLLIANDCDSFNEFNHQKAFISSNFKTLVEKIHTNRVQKQ